MKPDSLPAFRPLTVALGTALALLTCPIPARADVGVPMLMLMAVPMWASLLVIIPLEAFYARKVVGGGWGPSFKLSAITNLISTVVGVPITWMLLVLVQIPLMGLAAYLYAGRVPPGVGAGLAAAGGRALGVILGGAWLYPYEGEFFWLVPAAALVMCVPFFYASVWIEYLVGRRLRPREQSPLVRQWAWKANLASYSLLALVPAVLLVRGMTQHTLTMQDEEHRSVDQVSGDRLWQLALAREHARQESAPRSRPVPTGAIDARPKAANRADSLWLTGDDAHRAQDDARAERDWVAAIAEYDLLDRAQAAARNGRGSSAISQSEAVYSLAHLYFAQARYAEAKPIFERLVRVRDSWTDRGVHLAFPEYPLDLGVVYEKTGDSGRAEQYYRHVVDREGRLAEANDNVLLGALVRLADRLAARGDSSHAEELYRRAVSMQKDVFDQSNADRALRQLAKIWRAQRRFVEAETLLTSGIARNASMYPDREFPDSSAVGPLFLDLAMVFLDEGALPEAEHAVKTAMRWDSRLREVAEAYSLVLERQGMAAEAKAWHERASTVPP